MYSVKEKQNHFIEILSVQHAERDLELLREHNPDVAKSLQVHSGERLEQEVLFVLLDYVSREDIIHHRRNDNPSGATVEQHKATIDEMLVEFEAMSKEERLIAVDNLNTLIVLLPEEDQDVFYAKMEAIAAQQAETDEPVPDVPADPAPKGRKKGAQKANADAAADAAPQPEAKAEEVAETTEEVAEEAAESTIEAAETAEQEPEEVAEAPAEKKSI